MPTWLGKQGKEARAYERLVLDKATQVSVRDKFGMANKTPEQVKTKFRNMRRKLRNAGKLPEAI